MNANKLTQPAALSAAASGFEMRCRNVSRLEVEAFSMSSSSSLHVPTRASNQPMYSDRNTAQQLLNPLTAGPHILVFFHFLLPR